jgi:hypothetical protein
LKRTSELTASGNLNVPPWLHLTLPASLSRHDTELQIDHATQAVSPVIESWRWIGGRSGGIMRVSPAHRTVFMVQSDRQHVAKWYHCHSAKICLDIVLMSHGK